MADLLEAIREENRRLRALLKQCRPLVNEEAETYRYAVDLYDEIDAILKETPK